MSLEEENNQQELRELARAFLKNSTCIGAYLTHLYKEVCNKKVKAKGNITEEKESETKASNSKKEEPKMPRDYIKPEKFSAAPGERIRIFLQKFEIAANINEWDEEKKLRNLPAFLNGHAY